MYGHDGIYGIYYTCSTMRVSLFIYLFIYLFIFVLREKYYSVKT